MRLNKAAEIIKCHPRTVLRAIHDFDPNPYWADAYDPTYSMEEIADAFNVKLSIFRRCLEGRDAFLRPAEACALLRVIPRTFRYRHYEPTIKKNLIVRYSHIHIMQQQSIRYKDEFLAIL